jgi:hypothetical protein
MTYELADGLANQMWAAMMNKAPDFSEVTFSETALSIYEAFDAGECYHLMKGPCRGFHDPAVAHDPCPANVAW